MKIDPNNYVEPNIDKIVKYPCPFCGNDLEFQFGESMDKTELTFICPHDKKRIVVTKYE